MVHKILAYKLEGIGIQPGDTPVEQTQNLEKIISQIIGVLSVVAVIWFIFQVIFAGYAYMSSQGDKTKLETARKRLTQGILGLVISLIAIFIGALIAKLAGFKNIFDLNRQFNQMGL
ncbi:hypothetical protein DRH14_00085 [Candidatus Shapirobacteria bacterium]|nr:MAG: hypothetical protein DRH14_00085 [Candidatus Shapirobacteria bacterium]